MTYLESLFQNLALDPRIKTIASCCGGKGVSIWNNTSQQWNCSDCGAVKSNDPNYLYGGRNSPEDTPKFWKEKSKCTCGSEKTYGPLGTHTQWCDKK